MLTLQVLSGDATGRVFEFDEPKLLAGAGATVGRAAQNTICLADFHLSSEHGQLFHEGAHVVYRDLRSTNGSAVERDGARIPVDGTRAHELALRDGDRLCLGDPETAVILAVRLVTAAPTGPSERVLASRAISDLPAVAVALEQNPQVASALYRAAKRIGAASDLAESLAAIGESVLELLPRATHVALFVRSEADEERFVIAASQVRASIVVSPSPAAGAPVYASRAVLRRVLDERAAVLVANAIEELGGTESLLAGRILSTLAAPMWRGDGIQGVIQVDNRASAGMFTAADLDLLMVLAQQAALALENARLISRLRVAEERLRGENRYLKRREERRRVAEIIGDAPAMRAVQRQLEKVTDTRATVCITGETGTGKELAASAVHYQSRRKDKLFVAQNCAALPENLLESELFGHKKGAFTGADQDKKGLFELADGGSLFLDEIAEMSMPLQAKLLRVLQEGTFRPVGATTEKQVDVRIICATHRNLAEEVDKGRFRQDLYYRLMVFPIRIPSLRERREDVPLLAAHFLARYVAEYHRSVAGFTPAALDALAAYAWPGNIRELENEVQRLVIQSDPDAFLDVPQLSPQLRKIEGTVARVAPKKGTLKEMTDDVERWLLIEALRDHGGNKTRTAETLGITREGLHKKLTRFGI